MTFILYRSCDVHGPFIVVPDCMKASVEAERLYGPLDLLGEVDLREVTPAIRARVNQEIDKRTFAVLKSDEVPIDWRACA